MNENISAFIHGLNENDLREVEKYAASRSTAVLVLVFTDMQGSSALKQQMTEVASEQDFHNTVKKAHDEILGEVISRDGSGAIIKDTGDGFFAVFAEPSTAVERALEVQAALHGHPFITVRIGMDMGQVIVQSSGGLQRDMFGRHVDWASRAMSLAEGGHILVTKAVATDAVGFINKRQMKCKRHGLYVVKRDEGSLEVFEPYNANITQPMLLLHGEHVEDSISGQSTAHAQAGPTPLAGAKSSSPPRLPLLKWIGQKRAVALGTGLAFAVLLILIVVTKPDFWTQRRVPISSEDIEKVYAQGLYYAARIRELPMVASRYKAELKTLAERLWTDPRYSESAPQQIALIYRLYAATLLFRPSRMEDIVQSSLPWLRKAIELDKKTKDYQELKAAEQFFIAFADGKVPEVELQILLKHKFRVAMPEASAEEVGHRVQEYIIAIEELVRRRPGGTSPKEDFEYLAAQRIGNFTIGQVMKTRQIELKGRFPEKDVDSYPIFVPSSNGNTMVTYVFHGATTDTYEWEVSKANELIRPLNDAAREIMEPKSKP